VLVSAVPLLGWSLVAFVAYVALSKSVRKWQGADGSIEEEHGTSWVPEIREAGKWAMCAAGIFGGAWGAAVLSTATKTAGTTTTSAPGAPNTPTIAVTVVDTSTWWVDFSAFVGSGSDTQDSIHVQVDRVGGNFSSPLTDVKSGVQTRDTLSDNSDWKADSTYIVRGRQKGVAGGWSAYDSVTVVNTVDVAVFAMDYSSGAALGGGWAVGPTDPAEITISRQAGLGPSGQDVYRYAFTSGGAGGGDFGFGHGNTGSPITGAPFAYGDTAYLRFRFRFTSGTNGRFYEQGGGGGLAAIGRTKFLILNDASSGTTSRFILNVELDRLLGGYFWRLQKGGGTDPVASDTTASFDTDWHDIQVGIFYSSGAGVADGKYCIWVDTNTFGSGRCAASIVMQADTDPGEVKLGAYQNNSIYSDGVYGFEQTDFRISGSFSSVWDN